MESDFQFGAIIADGSRGIISCRRVPPPGEWTQNVCWPMQQCPPVSDQQYIYACLVNILCICRQMCTCVEV